MTRYFRWQPVATGVVLLWLTMTGAQNLLVVNQTEKDRWTEYRQAPVKESDHHTKHLYAGGVNFFVISFRLRVADNLCDPLLLF